ncbi:MAG: hypothetical protein IKO01_09240 [Kiritimatiellae bacterium]|nr:hypothetical protein [Kiritimatiellia bacterium]
MTAPAPSMPPPSALREWASRLRAWNAWRRGTGGARPESQREYGALLDVVADALIAIADALKAMERGKR